MISFFATIFFIPEFSKAEKVSYSAQLRVLKEKKLWLALAGVLVINGSIFGVYSYVSSYLGDVLSLPVQMASAVLLHTV